VDDFWFSFGYAIKKLFGGQIRMLDGSNENAGALGAGEVKRDTSGTSTFVKGAAILGIAAVIVKVMGAIFRIPLANMIGDNGMGYYQTAYPIYNFILVISTAGIPTSIAKITSEKLAIGDVKGADRVFDVMSKVMTAVGLVMMIFLIIAAKPLTEYLNNEKAYLSVVAIAPSVLFVSMMAVYRGYFQGRQRMQGYAMSQISEQFVRVGLGLSLAFVFINMGLEYSSAGATFGASAGSLCGFIVIFLMLRKFKRQTSKVVVHEGEHEVESASNIVKNLLKVAIPITIGASVMPVMTLFDLAIVFRRLQDIGYSAVASNQLYGQLTGYAQTLVNLPQVLTAGIAISIVPAISHYAKLRDDKGKEMTIEAGLRLALIIGLPSAVGLSVLSKEIMLLLYPMQKGIAQNTGDILFILGFGIIFLSFFQVSTGILQGLGKQKLPARNLVVGAVFKMVLSYVLVGMPMLNIRGAALSTVIAFGVAAGLNFMTLIKYSETRIDHVKIFIKPIIDVIVMAVCVKISYIVLSGVLPASLATAISVVIGGIVFVVMLLATNTLTKEDLDMIPGGARLKKLQSAFSRKQ
jgi:stage V sporulation protein B